MGQIKPGQSGIYLGRAILAHWASLKCVRSSFNWCRCNFHFPRSCCCFHQGLRKLRIYQDKDTSLRMPNKWHIFKDGKAGNKKMQLLVFNELPSLPSAGSRPGCSHTSLGCEPRSLIRVYLGWFDYSKNVRKDNPTTSAYSSVSDRRRPPALVEVHWARRAQAPMSQISGPNSQENHIIETCKEVGCAVSTQETAARRKCEMEHLTRLSAPWTDSHQMSHN
jgi:hypothetical protein